MKQLLFILAVTALVGCGEQEVAFSPADGADGTGCTVEEVPGGANITCGEEVTFIADGEDGQDGATGQPGQDAATLTTVALPAGGCSQVGPGIWAENVRNGQLFDVYLNANCEDRDGEYCDNVIPSYGRSGQLDSDEHPGSGTVCWAGDYQISGYKTSKNSKDIVIKVLDFNPGGN